MNRQLSQQPRGVSPIDGFRQSSQNRTEENEAPESVEDADSHQSTEHQSLPGYASLSIIGSELKAGNDINLYNVVGNLTIYNTPILERIKALLQPVDASFDSYSSTSDHQSLCFEGTRVGLLDEILTWLDDQTNEPPIYILDGVAGIGKSTVARTIAQRASERGVLGASFAFSRYEDRKRTARSFFSTIAFQLACYMEAYAHSISDTLRNQPDAAQKNFQSQSLSLFLEPLKTLRSQENPNFLIVIDALDECKEDEASALLSLLSQHLHETPALKVFITTRPERHIRYVLDSERNYKLFHLHDIETSVVQADIRLFLNFSLSHEQIRKLHQEIQWQPKEEELKILYNLCGTLFITATTAVRFILDDKQLDPQRQLHRLLDEVSQSSRSGYTDGMDTIYIQILRSAFPGNPDGVDLEWVRRYQTVVGSILCLQTPLPCQALAKLIGVTVGYIEVAVQNLHSLVAPSGSNPVYRVHHRSFPEFITSLDRIQRALHSSLDSDLYLASKLLINIPSHHCKMAKFCFHTMESNFFAPQISILTGNNASSGDNRIRQSYLHPSAHDLAYAGSHWVGHLDLAGYLDDEIQEKIALWARNHVIFWLRLMSSLNQIDIAYSLLEKARNIIGRDTGSWTDRPFIQAILSDTCRMIQLNGDVMKISPTHVSWSSLPFIPSTSALSTVYGSMNILKVISGNETAWNSALATLTGHSTAVMHAVFSADMSRLASASKDTTVRLWNGRTGAHIATLSHHLYDVRYIAFSPDGSRLISASDDRTICLWDASSGAHITTLTTHSAIKVVTFSGDGSTIISVTEDGTVRFWNGSSGAYIKTTIRSHPFVAKSVTLSSDGLKIASSSQDCTVQLWEGETGYCIGDLSGHSGRINALAFTNDEMRIASASDDSSVRIWDWETSAQIAVLSQHEGPVELVLFSRDDLMLASVSADRKIRLWHGKTYAYITTLRGHTGHINSVAFFNDCLRVATASDDRTIRLWDAANGTCITTLNGHSGWVNSIAISSDDSRLVSTSDDGTVRLWDVGGLPLASPVLGHISNVTALTFAGNGSRLASASSDGRLHLWNGWTGAHLSDLGDHAGGIVYVTFSDNASRLVSVSSSGEVRLWNSREGSLIASFPNYSEQAESVAISMDGLRVASASADHAIHLIRAKTGSHITALRGHSGRINSLSFSPNGGRIASGSDDCSIRIWKGKDGAPIGILDGHLQRIKTVIFSPDPSSSTLLSVSIDNEIRLWDGVTGRRTALLRRYSRVKSVTFSWDGQTFASTHPDNTIHLWNSRTGAGAAVYAEHPYLLDSIAFLNPFSQVNTGSRSNSPGSQSGAYSTAFLTLVQRDTPRLSGLVAVFLRTDGKWDTVPFCWLPPHLNVSTFTVNASGSVVAIGCRNGRTLLIDISKVFSN